MKVTPTSLPDLLVVEPEIYEDARGFLYESFNQEEFEALTGVRGTWVQDNHSRSRRGVLRGLHYQIGRPQGKLVRCTRGSVFDVAVDLRRSSESFGGWFGIELSEENRKQLWLPEGFAHGFLVLSEAADTQYKVTAYYDPAGERTIRWNDPRIGVVWPLATEPILSQKDEAAPYLADAEVFD